MSHVCVIYLCKESLQTLDMLIPLFTLQVISMLPIFFSNTTPRLIIKLKLAVHLLWWLQGLLMLKPFIPNI